ncbi:MAG TPA: hypothetical protein VKU19_06530 [Bryobacteraceae bacterium]|nr:hypothetical protein [Bryobacteraceae bacterium]
MLTSRQMSPEAWARVFDALVFYFTRRLGELNAEDLAQQTLVAVLKRVDYQFEKEEDFLRVCYGFATNILKAAYRQGGRDAHVSLEDFIPEPENRTSASGIENAIFLDDVLREGQRQLKKRDWELIREAAEAQLDNQPHNYPSGKENKFRVALHRARGKLAQVVRRRDDKM